mgnify:CR=1 FL=1
MGAGKQEVNLAGRAKMRSPGRPPVLHRSRRRPFWLAIADGHSTEDAARIAVVSPALAASFCEVTAGLLDAVAAGPLDAFADALIEIANERTKLVSERTKSEAVEEYEKRTAAARRSAEQADLGSIDQRGRSRIEKLGFEVAGHFAPSQR